MKRVVLNYLVIKVMVVVVALTSCNKHDEDPTEQNNQDGVWINGVVWAKCNVDEIGKFASTPESAGKFYQWNRKKAWSASEPTAGIAINNWDTSMPTCIAWEKVNDPSPVGWRIPTIDEFKKLLEKDKVDQEWTSQNGMNGIKFTDKITGNSIFLPAFNGRDGDNGSLSTTAGNNYGNYWSSTPSENSEISVQYLGFSVFSGVYIGGGIRPIYAFPVRCVSEYNNYPKEFTVTFETGVVGNTIAPQIVKTGEKAIKPEKEPTRSGYIFLGWYTLTNEWVFDTNVVTADVTLYAKWIATEFTDGLWLKMGDGSFVSTSDIDFYDVSLHTIYLKKKASYLKNIHGTVSMYVGNEEIYKCTIHSGLCSHIPMGQPYIYDLISNEEKICILFNPNNEQQVDPRSDERIFAALQKNNQYHEGLRCEIQSVDVSSEKIVLNIELYNPDTFDYYHLDPDKMGIGLFHYFTNGLYFRNDKYQSFTHKETVVRPEPWNSWEKEWLTLIKSGECKIISITYQHFAVIPTGKYKMIFCFPGLSRISQENWILEDGRIWMGSICTEKDIIIQ